MRSRALRIAILLFEALWLNVIVPGHTRGIVALPDRQCSACEPGSAPAPVPSCCRLREGRGGGQGSSAPKHGDPALRCAICYFAARLSVPVAVDFTHPPLGLVGIVLPQWAQSTPRVFFVATYDGRGPPPAPSISRSSIA